MSSSKLALLTASAKQASDLVSSKLALLTASAKQASDLVVSSLTDTYSTRPELCNSVFSVLLAGGVHKLATIQGNESTDKILAAIKKTPDNTPTITVSVNDDTTIISVNIDGPKE